MLSALILVMIQLTVAWSLLSTMGNQYGACASNSDCGVAMWCTVARHPKSDLSGICLNCGPRDGIRPDFTPQFCEADGEVAADVDVAHFQQVIEAGDPMLKIPAPLGVTLTDEDITAMCYACTNRHGYRPPAAATNLGGMGVRESVMFLLVAIAASLCVMEEALCIGKTLLYIHRASPPPLPEEPSSRSSNRGWWRVKRNALLLLQTIRIFMLASVLQCVPLFVLFDAADGVSILLNTIAALFILELDNLAFAFGVRELERTPLLEPFAVAKMDAINVERGKEMVAFAAMLGLCLVPLGASWEGGYLVVPWFLLLLACFAGETLLVVQGGGHRPAALCVARLALIVGLTHFYPLLYSNGTWWLGL